MQDTDRAGVAATRPRRSPRVALSELRDVLPGDSTISGDETTVVTGLSLSTQRLVRGDLYAALPGSRVHGIDFVADALDAGAVAVLTDEVGASRVRPGSPLLAGVPVVVTPDPRRVLGRLAARVYGDPAAALRMVGVTGTQGKTTTTRLLEGGLQRAGVTSGVIGTVGTRIAGKDVKTSLTTPEAPDLHALFARMREQKVKACAMEVSSHALVLGRVDGVVFDVAVFLNLGRDHLDFHRDLADYYAAKASLFTPERARMGLVNVDDEHGRRLAAEAQIPIRTFSASPLAGTDADWRAVDVELGPQGSTFTVVGPDVRFEARCPLPGDFNVANALAAIAGAAEAGLDAQRVANGIGQGGGVPGRLERVEGGQDFTVVVDYAHKPDAVEAAIRTLRPLTGGRVIVVIGAGGDRDAGKRPVMGELAARLADVVVVTDDNPRTEDPAAIRAAVLEGARRGSADVLERDDRRAAIEEAIGAARTGDIVLIAGKGHETGQEVDGVVHAFDDRQVAREALAALRRDAAE
ncbi:UDP-N-acetylmuramoylalanyl-D-glutamate--2,6-diaminopimelate ligase [Nocardioides terrae]|uniref:UDP-N-acetylmuramoyl-L-alanyl-D-glutamate--2,6-diaminopimelate ligase n=1 Tax=Nocardioides terrae TaxID=574651 RepID=A0A1I1G0E0_9ACTN|nr:UDP-N-acetylmuramoyl-L-alanyl-D-glutamate--2,6-diaminopimelate ligase [Nocardioides terrae]SFC04776.1 UDP-N-acetylmuramoylalanyl-D-glutamate--2,6-diaminopimelate ligase [Nocardioides terrae]